jgi:Domain of unknown function (DUF4280)
MGLQVVEKAWVLCNQGTCPTRLHVTPSGMAAGKAEAVMAGEFEINIPPMDGLVTRLNAAGQVAQKLMYVAGQLEGVSTLYGAGGMEIQLPYVKGSLEGAANFAMAGKKTAELAFKAGMMEGISHMYNAEGELAMSASYVNNARHGLTVMFYAGAVAKAEMYVQGALQAKGQMEAELEGGGQLAFETGLSYANSLIGKVPPPNPMQLEAEVELQLGAGLTAAANAAIQDASQMEALAAATLQAALSLQASAGVFGAAGAEMKVSGTIMDHLPIQNIRPFCLCMSPSNPLVAAATAAALGVLIPMPCIPNTLSPWVPGAAGVTINNNLALDNTSKLMCAWGGVISVLDPNQTAVTIP